MRAKNCPECRLCPVHERKPPVPRAPREVTEETRRMQRGRHGATKIGISPEEYIAHLEEGEKWCSGHKRWCQRADFGRCSTRRDGLATACRAAVTEYARQHSRPRMVPEQRAASTRLAGIRQAATRLGISEHEYRERRERGERWCSGHRAWEDGAAFGKAASSYCRAWNNARARARIKARWHGLLTTPWPDPPGGCLDCRTNERGHYARGLCGRCYGRIHQRERAATKRQERAS